MHTLHYVHRFIADHKSINISVHISYIHPKLTPSTDYIRAGYVPKFHHHSCNIQNAMPYFSFSMNLQCPSLHCRSPKTMFQGNKTTPDHDNPILNAPVGVNKHSKAHPEGQASNNRIICPHIPHCLKLL